MPRMPSEPGAQAGIGQCPCALPAPVTGVDRDRVPLECAACPSSTRERLEDLIAWLLRGILMADVSQALAALLGVDAVGRSAWTVGLLKDVSSHCLSNRVCLEPGAVVFAHGERPTSDRPGVAGRCFSPTSGRDHGRLSD